MKTINKIKRNNKSKKAEVPSFFASDKKLFKIFSLIAIAINVIMVSYLTVSIILPFYNNYSIMNALSYFGWPLYTTLMLFIWLPGLFVAFNMYRKKRFTDYQFILEKRSIMRAAVILLVPTFGISALFFIFRKRFVMSERFKAYQKEHGDDLRSQLWLSDSRPMRASESASLGIAWLVVILWSAIIIFPIYKLVKQTFNGNLEFLLGASDGYSFSFKHFTRLFENYAYMKWMGNTLFISFITMVIVVILSSFSAFIYSRYRFKTKKTSLLLVMTLGLIPAAAAIAAYYVLSVILDQGLHLGAKWLLIFIYAGGGTVGNIFILKGYLDNISTELDDAARIDGCSKARLFFRVILPLMKPMLAITAIGSFTGPFGDFILPGILFNDPSNFTLAQGLQMLATGTSADQTAFAAGAIIIAVPITAIIMISQTLLTKGGAAGGVKG